MLLILFSPKQLHHKDVLRPETLKCNRNAAGWGGGTIMFGHGTIHLCLVQVHPYFQSFLNILNFTHVKG